jgi:Flp pilus assembly CpaF family ATPase
MYERYDITQIPEWNLCFNLLFEDDVSEIASNGPGEFFYKKGGERLIVDKARLPSNQDSRSYRDGIAKGLVPFVNSIDLYNEEGYLFEGPIYLKNDENEMVRGRCHIVLPPAAEEPQVTIAKKSTSLSTLDSIAENGSMSSEMLQFLKTAVRSDLTIAISGGTGAGKALTLTREIPTPTGSVTMGDIKVGDQIFDYHGNIGNVTHKFPQPPRQVFKVKFNTGEEIECDGDHNWWVSDFSSRKSHIHRPLEKERLGQAAKRVPSLSPEVTKRLQAILDQTLPSDRISLKEIIQISGRSFSGGRYVDELRRVSYVDNSNSRKSLSKQKALDWLINVYANTFSDDQRDNRQSLYSVKTTRELLNEQLQDPSGRNKFHIPVLEQALSYVHSKEKSTGLNPNELPIHPYVLGLWLGDGNSYSPEFAAQVDDGNAYNQILEELETSDRLLKLNRPHAWKFTTPDFRNKLKGLGLMKKIPGGNKQIPLMYELSSEESRRLLLAGLIDTDGSSSKSTWEFGGTSRQMIDSVYNIACGLGYAARISNTRFKKYPYYDEIRIGKPSWAVSIPTVDLLALLPRKTDKHRDYIKSHSSAMRRDSTRIIKEIITTDRVEPMACITVDTPDSTYLIDRGCITTHNTTMLEALSKFWTPETRIGVAEDTPELDLVQPNVTYLHSVPWRPGLDPNKVATLSWVVQQYLRMRIDKIIVGETRGSEFAEFLTAANSGMEGSLTTIHSNSPVLALDKMTNFVLRGNAGSNIRTINNDIANAIDIIVQIQRLPNGFYRTTEISEVTTTLANNDGAKISTNHVFQYIPQGDAFKKVNQMTDNLRTHFLSRGVNLDLFTAADAGSTAQGHSSDRFQEEDIPAPQRGLPTRQFPRTL